LILSAFFSLVDASFSFSKIAQVTQKEVDDRGWALNDNCLMLHDDLVIDIPPAFSSTSTYCASLGHKANHGLDPNAMYDLIFHPRFGDIKCVRAVEPIPMGTEILVDYGFTEEKPEWFEKLMADNPLAVGSLLTKKRSRRSNHGIQKDSPTKQRKIRM
jgi:hypothetical protein